MWKLSFQIFVNPFETIVYSNTLNVQPYFHVKLKYYILTWFWQSFDSDFESVINSAMSKHRLWRTYNSVTARVLFLDLMLEMMCYSYKGTISIENEHPNPHCLQVFITVDDGLIGGHEQGVEGKVLLDIMFDNEEYEDQFTHNT